MPIPFCPPYNPNAITPRTIQRWLDINAQNGQLGRTQTYVTLPAFNVSGINWQGYSDIVTAFNVEAPNNFSFRWLTGYAVEGLGTDIQSNPNYMLCVMWIDSTTVPYTVHRYAIWKNVGEVVYFDLPLYTGQLIKKNFRFEVWSVGGKTTASQGIPVNLYTTKLGSQDYRYGSDAPLANTDSEVTNFSAGLLNPVLLPTDIGVLFQTDPFSGIAFDGSFNLTSWTSFGSSTGPFTPVGTVVVSESNLPVGGRSITITNSISHIVANTGNIGVQCLITCFRMFSHIPSNNPLFSAYPTGISLFWNNGTITTGGGGPIVTGLNLVQWYTVILFLNGGLMSLYVYDTATGTLVMSNTTAAPAVTYTNALVFGNDDMEVVECIAGSNTISAGDLTAINNYFTTKYFVGNNFTLPFVWPAGATPQLN